MECSGICHDDKAVYFKVTCPGFFKDLPHKLRIQDRRANKENKDICQEPKHNATVAYNNEYFNFELDNEGKMVEYQIEPITGVATTIPWEWEIISSFLENYHIKTTWIDCNGTWGWFDEETGHWTGAVGKVHIV